MEGGAVQLQIGQFLLIYVLLLLVLVIMQRSKLGQTKQLLIASIRMTVQLILVGFVLQAIFQNPHPAFTVLFILCTVAFSIHRVLSRNRGLNRRFQGIIAGSLALSGAGVLVFFVCVVVGRSFFDPQYTIPLSGMIIGNAMTGVSLGLKTFLESLDSEQLRIETMMNLGVSFQKILRPMVNRALESALLPTINSMLGMGIIFLPGMMTGQILSGTLPTTAILYQIAIMIAICTSVCLTTWLSLNLGYQTLYNDKNQYLGPQGKPDGKNT